ncbi:methyltransferase domain-containing protein [Sulfurimonas sp. SAG-AH-194-I05]|nr:methyltransferase domain-containing protein [Sulfurimonas sp. SAG-AH-194-I05]MDF1875772.1 methyltransferase domain-containing protein [Sulfurimonas sp. SAG-AH-194-I05]
MQKSIPLVHEIMEKNIINSTSIDKLENHSLTNFIEGALFITDTKGALIGVVTDGDVRKNCSIQDKAQINDIVTHNPKKIHRTENASVALRILREEEINILPVIDDNNILVGYISLHMLLKSFSPERLYISQTNELNDDNEERHFARYQFALNFITRDGYSLDCACGSGYGSKLISKSSAKVLGVDLSHDAVNFAKENNKMTNIEFIQKDIDKLNFNANTFDSIISIETLEHVPNNVFLSFLENTNKWLKTGGVFIGSSPMLRFKDGKPFITNPYHINEMSKEDFIKAIESKLPNFQIHFYYQDQDVFLPLCEEHTGFCIVVARKKA